MQINGNEELVELIYSEVKNRIDEYIDKKIEEKITEILYSPILEEKEWPRKKRT